jgi:hypothetical protein
MNNKIEKNVKVKWTEDGKEQEGSIDVTFDKDDKVSISMDTKLMAHLGKEIGAEIWKRIMALRKKKSVPGETEAIVLSERKNVPVKRR